MEDEMLINYETLFELLRLERTRSELQKIPKDYNTDIKKLILESLKNDMDSSKNKTNINNTLKIINEIYERREKKIISLALNKSKVASSIVEVDLMTESEVNLYEDILKILNSSRIDFNDKVIKSEMHNQADINDQKLNESDDFKQTSQIPDDKIPKDILPTKTGSTTIRFLKSIPSFLDMNLEKHGPYSEEDIALIPTQIAKLLIEKKRAEEILIN